MKAIALTRLAAVLVLVSIMLAVMGETMIASITVAVLIYGLVLSEVALNITATEPAGSHRVADQSVLAHVCKPA